MFRFPVEENIIATFSVFYLHMQAHMGIWSVTNVKLEGDCNQVWPNYV